MKHGGAGGAPTEREAEAFSRPGQASDGDPNAPQLLVREGVNANELVFVPRLAG